MAAPFRGVRVVEMVSRETWALAGAVLAEMGAEVVRVPHPPHSNRSTRSHGDESLVGAESSPYYLEIANRHKKLAVLDLETSAGKAALYDLIRQADVFLHSYPADVAEGLGIDYGALSRHNPLLIYATGWGYGPQGPDRGRAYSDLLVQARSGMLSIGGEPDEPPVYLRGLSYQAGALMLAFGVAVALHVRRRTGIGQEVSTSLLGTMVYLQGVPLHEYLFSGEVAPRKSRKHRTMRNVYCCGDGKWIEMALIQSDRFWGDLCELLGLGELTDDPRFNSAINRQANGSQLCPLLDRAFAARTRPEWLRLLQEKGIPCAPLQDHAEVVRDPQVLANGYVVDGDAPTGGRLRVVATPIQFGETPVGQRLR